MKKKHKSRSRIKCSKSNNPVLNISCTHFNLVLGSQIYIFLFLKKVGFSVSKKLFVKKKIIKGLKKHRHLKQIDKKK